MIRNFDFAVRSRCHADFAKIHLQYGKDANTFLIFFSKYPITPAPLRGAGSIVLRAGSIVLWAHDLRREAQNGMAHWRAGNVVSGASTLPTSFLDTLSTLWSCLASRKLCRRVIGLYLSVMIHGS